MVSRVFLQVIEDFAHGQTWPGANFLQVRITTSWWDSLCLSTLLWTCISLHMPPILSKEQHERLELTQTQLLKDNPPLSSCASCTGRLHIKLSTSPLLSCLITMCCNNNYTVPSIHCDESHFYLYFSSFFPYIFDTITTKRWQVANKETLLQHSQALWPSWPSQSTWPSWLTWHYQDYDNNHDDRAGFLLAIQYASIYSAALLSLLSFH